MIGVQLNTVSVWVAFLIVVIAPALSRALCYIVQFVFEYFSKKRRNRKKKQKKGLTPLRDRSNLSKLSIKPLPIVHVCAIIQNFNAHEWAVFLCQKGISKKHIMLILFCFALCFPAFQ